MLDFQDYVEIQRGTFGLQLEFVSVVTILRQIVQLFGFSTGESKHVELQMRNIRSSVKCLLDKQRIKQVLANLVSNAIK